MWRGCGTWRWGSKRLDDEALGLLWVEARLERQEARGMLYGLKVEGALGQAVASGMASISIPGSGPA